MPKEESFLAEVSARRRFRFGQNWRHFLSTLSETQISRAQDSLTQTLQAQSLAGKTFLDIGSGSGLFSLAARRLGARVSSIDYDPDSVSCTNELRLRYFADDPDWSVRQMSILDDATLRDLGVFDVIYAWGVLHHTGHIWRAMENTARLAGPDAVLVLALYNDQGLVSNYWKAVKTTYNRRPYLRPLLVAAHLPLLVLPRLLVRFLTGRLRLERGMSYYHDALDWLGGYPFEVSKPDQVIGFLSEKGFHLRSLKTVGRRMGCNEYLFARR